MAAGANLGEKLFGMVKTIGPVFQSYAPGLGLLDLAVGVAGAVILYFMGPVDKSKNSAEPCSGPGRIVNWEIEKDGILPSA